MAYQTTKEKSGDDKNPGGMSDISTLKEDHGALFVKSVAKAFAVIEAMHHASRALSLSQIAALTGIDRSAAQRLCHTLITLGYLERSPDQGGGIVPGTKILDRAFDFYRHNPLAERASAVLLNLKRDVPERVNFSLFDGPTLIYAIRLPSSRISYWQTLPGRRVPTFCTAGGRAILAQLDDESVARVLAESDIKKQTPYTIVDHKNIMSNIREARSNGYGYSSQEMVIGELVVGASVRGRSGAPLGAVHIAGSTSEWEKEEFCKRYAPLAVAAAEAISGEK